MTRHLPGFALGLLASSAPARLHRSMRALLLPLVFAVGLAMLVGYTVHAREAELQRCRSTTDCGPRGVVVLDEDGCGCVWEGPGR